MAAERVTYGNGRVFTGHGGPLASWFTVRAGVVEAVGSGPAPGDVRDLGGRLVIPGLVDAHCHPELLANAADEIALTPPAVRSVKDIQTAVAERRRTIRGGDWIVGWGYDEGKLAEGRPPTRWDLDAVSPDVPVVLVRACGHMACVNSAVLTRLHIDRGTPDPPGGRIDRNRDGDPTGVLREQAKNLIDGVMPKRSRPDVSAALARLSPRLFAHGITALTELTATYRPSDPEQDSLAIYRAARAAGFRHPVSLYYVWDDIRRVADRPRPAGPFPAGLTLGGIKVFADGSVSGRTAWVAPPYQPYGEQAGDSGLGLIGADELREAQETAAAWRVQLAVHAMGEEAIDLVTKTLEGRADWLPDRPSVRIEHGALPTPGAIERARRSRIAFVMQPIFLFAEIESYLNNLGAERTALSHPLRSLLAAHVPVALSSDAPSTAWADPVNPWLALYTATTRRAHDGRVFGPDEAIDVLTALGLYTEGAAAASGLAGGVIRAGAPADFVVLDTDVLALPPESLRDVHVAATVMAGEVVWGALGA